MNEKVKAFARNYFYTIVAVAISVVYIFRGFVTFDKTGKTVWEVLADGIVILIMGIVIDFMFGAQGIENGRKMDRVIEAEERHSRLLKEVEPYSDVMQEFCEKKNAEAKKTLRKQIMMEYGYRYSDFFEEDGTIKPFPAVPGESKKETARRDKAYRKARDFKITMLTVSLLTSDNVSTKDPNAIGRSVTSFMVGQTKKDMTTKAAFSLFWGVYSVKILSDISWENLIATTLQMALLIGIGTMKLITSKMYIIGEYRERVETKNRFMEEFKLYLEKEHGNGIQKQIG